MTKPAASGGFLRVGRRASSVYAGPMQFSDEALDELREVYRSEWGMDITRDEAAEIGNRVVEFVQIVLRHGRPAASTPDGVDAPR